MTRSAFGRVTKPGLIAAGVLAGVAAVVAYPWIHNHHLAPLARLSRHVPVGSDCAAASRAFAAYYERQRARGNGDVQHADGSTADDAGLGDLSPPRRMLFLYDLTLFDDVQLTALCDPAGRRVERVMYVGD